MACRSNWSSRRNSARSATSSMPRRSAQKCREYAGEQIDGQSRDFQRLGVLGDWEHPYRTMDFRFEADMLRSLAKIVERGHLARGVKPVHWCFDCGSALAEAEIEYADKTSPAVDVAYDAIDPQALAATFGVDVGEAIVSVPIWTTTPWTLPASLAVTLGPDLDYVLVEGPARGGRRVLLVLAEALGRIARCSAMASSRSIVPRQRARARSSKLMQLQHPFYSRVVPVILGDHVTTEAGTGAVHTAPGHGQEDFVVGQKYGLRSAQSDRRRRRVPAEHRDLRRPVHLEGQRHHHRIAARARRAAGIRQAHPQLSALLAAQDAGGVPRHAAVVHLDGAGRPAPRRAGGDQGRALDSRLGRGAHRRHGRRPSGLVHQPPAHLGRADRVVRQPRIRRAASAQRRR